MEYETRTRTNTTFNKEIEILSQKKKNLRIKYENITDDKKVKELKSKCNIISHKIRKIIIENDEKHLNNIINEIENAENSTKMYKSVNLVNRRTIQNMFVYDSNNKTVTEPSEVHKIIKNHFENHFNKADKQIIQPFIEPLEKLQNPITTIDVHNAIKKMSNGKSPGEDKISVELIKYAPVSIKTEIAKIVNNHIENGGELNLGKGLLAALWKPNKEKGYVNHLRPVILLNVIRKILSNITLNRIRPNIDKFLSMSQSAYRANRSTTDIVWAYKWMIAKIQKYVKLKLFIVGIDLSSAFDTIDRNKLLDILKPIINNDEHRMIRILHSDTSLEIKMSNLNHQETFISNVGSPQGDAISGPLFNVYFESTLQDLRHAINQTVPNPNDEHNYTRKSITINNFQDHNYATNTAHFPKEMIYADDCDFITNDISQRNNIKEFMELVLTPYNLNVNKGKTELTTLERGRKPNENWRHVKKVGSLLGDVEDINRRKQLARNQMRSLNKIWFNKYKKVSLKTRVKLFNTLVKSVLLYNCSTWGLRKTDEESLNSFHRQLLRRICNIKWPDTISSKELYKLTKCQPICIDITQARWKYLGHVLRMESDCPPKQAMEWFFLPEINLKRYSGTPRTTIVTTIQRDIKNTKEKFCNFEIHNFSTTVDFEILCNLASDRNHWKKITKTVTDTAKANYSL